ncbi:MAG: T9SS type A sorting domain-containing protein [Bacteroidota bacterium]
MAKSQSSITRAKQQFACLFKTIQADQKNGKCKRSTSVRQQKLLDTLYRLFDRIQSYLNPRLRLKYLTGLSLIMSTGLLAPAQSLSFVQANPFGISVAANQQHICPSFVDIDGDGDLDLFYNGYGGFNFQENTGTATVPAFGPLQLDPYGLVNVYTTGYTSCDFGDLDNDGDFDLIQSGNRGQIFFYENTGTNTAASFAPAVADPFGAIVPTNPGAYGPGYFFTAELADLDNDGDIDLFVGGTEYLSFDGVLYYFENIGSATNPVFAAPTLGDFNLPNPHPVYSYKALALSDIDCDGDLDLMCGEDHTLQPLFFENTSGGFPPSFAAPVALGFGFSVPVALYYDVLTPEFADIDGDGDQELFVGREQNDILYFEKSCPIVLPIQLSAFSGKMIEGSAQLSWQTVHEENQASFVLEKSRDGQQFETLGQIQSAGSQEKNRYQFIDLSPFVGQNTYRLSAISLDGEIQILRSLSLEYEPGFADIHLRPNPTQATSSLFFTAERAEMVEVKLTNTAGAEVWKQTFSVQQGRNELALSLERIPTGMYFLHLRDRQHSRILRLVRE